MPWIRSRPHLLLRAVVLTAAGAIALTACAGPVPAPDSTDATAVAGCTPASATPLGDLDPVEDPRSITGPSSACLSSEAIQTPETAPVPQLPVTVTDNQGTEVTVTDASRILALDMSGTLAATVFALGLGDNVVGRDTSTGFDQAADLPLVTQGGHQLNAESILGLDPSVVITDSSIGPWDVVLQLRDAGIPVVVVTPQRSADTIGPLIDAVAEALGVPAAGTALAHEVAARLAQIEEQIAAIAPVDDADRLRMVFLYVRGAANVYYLFGEESGADALIRSLGGIDVASEIGIQGNRPLTAEALVEAAPDLVLVMTKGLESVGGVDGLLDAVPALAETPAGRNRRIVDMSDYDILSFGPRYPEVLDALARAIYTPEESEADAGSDADG